MSFPHLQPSFYTYNKTHIPYCSYKSLCVWSSLFSPTPFHIFSPLLRTVQPLWNFSVLWTHEDVVFTLGPFHILSLLPGQVFPGSSHGRFHFIHHPLTLTQCLRDFSLIIIYNQLLFITLSHLPYIYFTHGTCLFAY